MRMPAYLQEQFLYAGMRELPRRPFIVKPGRYSVIDGDTFSIRFPRRDGFDGMVEAFRVRFCSVNAAEKPPRRQDDAQMRALGIDLYANDPGELATRKLRELCKGRALLFVFPDNEEEFKHDRFRRVLAEVCVSGSPGEEFDLTGSSSLQYEMYRAGRAIPLPGSRIPPSWPEYLHQLDDALPSEAVESILDQPGLD